jgi:hypothetical protein
MHQVGKPLPGFLEQSPPATLGPGLEGIVTPIPLLQDLFATG